jgi:hypothetical protein
VRTSILSQFKTTAIRTECSGTTQRFLFIEQLCSVSPRIMEDNIGQEPDVITLSPAFKLILLVVLGLTILFLVVSLGLAILYSDPPEHVKGLLIACTHLFAAGAGAVFGLLGGKVT